MTDVNSVLKERRERYGSFEGMAEITIGLSQLIALQCIKRDKNLQADQAEALHMICHKIGRIVNGDPDYIDNWMDIAGYAKLVADRLQRDLKRNKVQNGIAG